MFYSASFRQQTWNTPVLPFAEEGDLRLFGPYPLCASSLKTRA
jgi:hypothetical protein